VQHHELYCRRAGLVARLSSGTYDQASHRPKHTSNDTLETLRDLAINRGGRTSFYQTIDTTLPAANSQGIRSETYSADFDESTCGGTQQTLEIILRDGSGTQEDAYQETITI